MSAKNSAPAVKASFEFNISEELAVRLIDAVRPPNIAGQVFLANAASELAASITEDREAEAREKSAGGGVIGDVLGEVIKSAIPKLVDIVTTSMFQPSDIPHPVVLPPQPQVAAQPVAPPVAPQIVEQAKAKVEKPKGAQ
jgi:hypothetical protein